MLYRFVPLSSDVISLCPIVQRCYTVLARMGPSGPVARRAMTGGRCTVPRVPLQAKHETCSTLPSSVRGVIDRGLVMTYPCFVQGCSLPIQ